MGYLDKTSVTVDAVLTKVGRTKLAQGEGINIRYFCVSDRGIDYTLYNPDHSLGSAYYDEAITELPNIEATPNATHYLTDKLDLDSYMENNPLSVRMFQSAKSTLNRINNINCLETFLYSHYLGLAGRVDCIAEFDGELAVIDFKTSTKIKQEEYIEHYYVQETAYAAMFLELTGIEVKKIVTLITVEDGSVQVFEKYNLDDYLQLLKSYIKEFVGRSNA